MELPCACPNPSRSPWPHSAEQVATFSSLEFRRDSIMSHVLEKGLKTLTEYMRMQTLGTPGLHLIQAPSPSAPPPLSSSSGPWCLQIDTYVMRLVLRSFTDEEAVLDTMLDEAISSAAERCLAPSPLDAQVLEQLCESKLVDLVG